jgi:hypothetical protein
MGTSNGRDPGFDRFQHFLDERSRRDFLRGMGGAVALSCPPGGAAAGWTTR